MNITPVITMLETPLRSMTAATKHFTAHQDQGRPHYSRHCTQHMGDQLLTSTPYRLRDRVLSVAEYAISATCPDPKIHNGNAPPPSPDPKTQPGNLVSGPVTHLKMRGSNPASPFQISGPGPGPPNPNLMCKCNLAYVIYRTLALRAVYGIAYA